MAKANGGEAGKSKTDDVLFAELKNKVIAGIEVKPEAGYLLLIKKGSLTKVERDVFLSLWARNLKSGALIFEVDDPEHDVRALEIIR